jgi:hypothetical protein
MRRRLPRSRAIDPPDRLPVADRDANRPLSSAKDLVRIEGIVQRREMNKDMMTVNDEPVQ